MEISKESLLLENSKLGKELMYAKAQIVAQRNLISKLMSKYPRKVWTCKKRNTTSVEMTNGDVIIVRKRKGEKWDTHTAVAYAIVKNLIGSEQFNRLVKNCVNYDPKD